MTIFLPLFPLFILIEQPQLVFSLVIVFFPFVMFRLSQLLCFFVAQDQR